MATPRRIGSALALQKHLEGLFFQAVESGDTKAAGYIAQIWVSAEGHAKDERKMKQEKNNSIDKLVKELQKQRKAHEIKEDSTDEE